VNGVSEKASWPKLTKEIIEGFASSCLTPFFDEASPFAEFHKELHLQSFIKNCGSCVVLQISL